MKHPTGPVLQPFLVLIYIYVGAKECRQTQGQLRAKMKKISQPGIPSRLCIKRRFNWDN